MFRLFLETSHLRARLVFTDAQRLLYRFDQKFTGILRSRILIVPFQSRVQSCHMCGPQKKNLDFSDFFCIFSCTIFFLKLMNSRSNWYGTANLVDLVSEAAAHKSLGNK